jgi:hypothetical protein
MKKKDIVMVKVERTTRDRLKARGTKGDTYEDVITKMFAELEEDVGDKKQ